MSEAQNTYDNDTLKLLARLIISLDDDGNVTERVTITEATRNAFTKEQHFKDMTVADVETLLSGIGKTLANECGALEAFGDTNVVCNDDGTYKNPPSNLKEGHLLDLPIEGVEYFCNDGNSGITDSNGTFWCVEAPMTFKIGGLTLGTLNNLLQI